MTTTTEAHQQNLRISCSVASFRASQIEVYRQDLTRCLQQIMSCSETLLVEEEEQGCRSTTTRDAFSLQCARYSASFLVDSFNAHVDWKDLCQHHDAHVERNVARKRAKSKQTTTIVATTSPLQEILAVLANPTILPRSCCNSVTVRVLLTAILQSPPRNRHCRPAGSSDCNNNNNNNNNACSRWSPSQLLLLKSITTLWHSCPSSSLSCTDTVLSCIQEPLSPSSSSSSSSSAPNKWNRLLSAINYLGKDSPHMQRSLATCVMTMIQRIDAHDVHLLQQVRSTTGDYEMTAPLVKTSNANTTGTPYCCPQCQHPIMPLEDNDSPPKRKRVKYASLLNLHDEDITATTTDVKEYYRPSRSQVWRKEVSLKAVLASKQRATKNPRGQCSCSNLQRRDNRQTDVSTISTEWALVRSRGYKKFCGIFHQHPSIRSSISGSPRLLMDRRRRRGSPSPCRFDTEHLLKLAALEDNVSSPSVRVCLLLVLHDGAGGGGLMGPYNNPFPYTRMVQTCWTQYLQSQNPLWLRLYSEFVVECACFDQRECCWKVVRPVLRHLILDNTSSIDSSQEDDGMHIIEDDADADDDSQEDGNPVESRDVDDSLTTTIFRCIAYVLSRRCRLFQMEKDGIHKEFQECLSYLAIRHGESKYWVDTNTRPAERRSTLETLQRVGILGLVDLEDDNDDDDDEEEVLAGTEDGQSKPHGSHRIVKSQRESCPKPDMRSCPALESWPFSEPYDLRSAYMRMGGDAIGAFNGNATPLSSPRCDAEVVLHQNRKDSSKKLDKAPCPPMLDYLNNDMLRLVFSFLGCKRLVKARSVCRLWKDIVDDSNSLWHGAYRARFGLLRQDPRADHDKAAIINSDWKYLFMTKFLAEQNIRFQRHGPTGFKYRTCGYIGCLAVLKSSSQEKNHYESHARKAEQRKRIRPRKKEQNEIAGRRRDTRKKLDTPTTKKKRQCHNKTQSVDKKKKAAPK